MASLTDRACKPLIRERVPAIKKPVISDSVCSKFYGVSSTAFLQNLLTFAEHTDRALVIAFSKNRRFPCCALAPVQPFRRYSLYGARNKSDSLKNSPPISAALQEKLDAIDNEVVLLHFKWTCLMQLFGKEKHVATINATAPSIFSVIEETMFTDILLSLMRLVDPPKSGGQANLSLRSLAADISDPALKAQVEALEVQVRAKAQDVKIWRDKKLAHNDLLRLLKKGAPVPSIQISELTSALTLIREAMNLVHGYFFGTTVLYDQCITKKDGNELLFYLNYGLECWTEDKEKEDFARARKLQKSNAEARAT
jgi:hypothetical protein